MSYLANIIVRNMVFKNDKINKNFKSKNFIGKRRTVNIDQITLKVRLNEPDFNDIKSKLANQEK